MQLGVREMVGVVQPIKEQMCVNMRVCYVVYSIKTVILLVRTFLWSRAVLADRHDFKGLFEI